MTPGIHEHIRGRALAPEGEPVFLFGGELHYFRIPRPLWRDRLRKARAAFLNLIGAYIPWNFHEKEEGRFDFEGDRDLRLWLEFIRESGMYLFARPGPYICSEWDGGGLPAWFFGKDRLARTDDPEYLEAVSRWFHAVNGIIRDFLPGIGGNRTGLKSAPAGFRGNLILYQIENELIWNEPQYFHHMVAWARRDGITCPLLTNLAPDVRKSPDIIDSLDLYPGPWNIHKPEVSIANLLEEQPDKPPACVELQMGFAAEAGSTLPTMAGPIDKEWVEVHTKNTIARGLNILNYYMFAGGTSFGYNTGRRDITSYDYDSAIREWGELGQKYYTVRRIGAFLERFGADIIRTLPAKDIPVQAPRGVSVLQRRGERSAFIFPRNLTRSPQSVTLTLTLPDGTETPFPSHIPLYIGPQRMKMLPVHVPLDENMTLAYSTSEIFSVMRYGGETIIIAYGDPGERGEILLRGAAGFYHLRGEGTAAVDRGGLLVSYLHRKGAFHILLTSGDVNEHPDRLRGVRIIAVDRETVECTWLMETSRGRLPILSNAYFLDEEPETTGADAEREEKPLFTTANKNPLPDNEMQDTGTLRMSLSRRPYAVNFLEFPCPMNGGVTPKASLDGAEIPVAVDRNLDIANIVLSAFNAPEKNISLSTWLMREENPLALNESPDWRPYRAFLGNERSGEYDGGYYAYRNRFHFSGDAAGMRLLFTELHDNADVWLNGTYAGGGSAANNNGLRLEIDVSASLRNGDNELFVLVENEARPRKGDDATLTGITGPAALTAAEVIMPLREWRRGFLSVETESAMGAIPAEILPGFDDATWDRIEVRPGWDSRLVIPPTTTYIEPGHERVYAVYRTAFTIQREHAGMGAILDAGKCDGKCWIYLNGFRADKKHQETFAADLTPYIHEGENTIALVIRNFRWYTTVGLHGNIRIRLVDRILEQDWEFIRGLPGQRECLPESETSGWLQIESSEAPSRVWLAAEFEHHPDPAWTMPLGLRLSGWNAKTLIYLNGFLAGRYHPEGPQEVFYLPEDHLRERNRIALFCNAHDKPVRIAEAEVMPYYMVKESELEISL